MFVSLTGKLLETLRLLNGTTRLTENILDEVCRQLRTSLLEADVHVKVVRDFVQAVRERSLNVEVQKSLTPEQHFIRIVYEELSTLLGSKAVDLNLNVRPPAVIMMVGIQGGGKTTTTVKIAKHLRDKLRKSSLLASVDVYRPAAIEQLKVLATANQIAYFENGGAKVKERAFLAQEEAIRQHADVLLLDTAGRTHIDDKMMDELLDLSNQLKPSEVLLVIDGMTGQDAVRIAESFQNRIPLTGVVLTKMDSDTRGGAALSVKAITGCPIKFLGTGEKVTDLEVMHPNRIASRILDMGDLLSLAEKAQDTLDPSETFKIAKKARKNDFTLADFFSQLQQIKKMGSLENLMKFLPGMGNLTRGLKDFSPPDTELRKIEAMILSMTPQERSEHTIIDGSRRRRIAKGSGTRVEDINRFIKQFLEARKMMTRMTKSAMGKHRRLW